MEKSTLLKGYCMFHDRIQQKPKPHTKNKYCVYWEPLQKVSMETTEAGGASQRNKGEK